MSDSSNRTSHVLSYILCYMRTTLVTVIFVCAAAATAQVRQSAQSRPCFSESGQTPAGSTQPAPVAPATIAQISWLSGNWVGGTGTRFAEERWTPARGGTMFGLGRTVRGDVMVEYEFLCIAERAGTLVYTAMPNAGPATDFTLTGIDAKSATFENPTHDFPKKIRYVNKPDGTMEAVVSGDASARSLTFAFRRQE